MLEKNKEQITDAVGKAYYLGLVKKYEADIAEAKANLLLYFSPKLAAIGEHSDLLEEHDKWVEKLANAQDKLNTLQENFVVVEKV
jgi:hypothetical protein